MPHKFLLFSFCSSTMTWTSPIFYEIELLMSFTRWQICVHYTPQQHAVQADILHFWVKFVSSKPTPIYVVGLTGTGADSETASLAFRSILLCSTEFKYLYIKLQNQEM